METKAPALTPTPPPQSLALPYRPAPRWAPPPRPAAAPAPAPLGARELLAAVGIVVAFDVATWSGGRPGTGGAGLAVLFAAAPLLAVVAARRWRASPRLAVLSALLAAVVVRTALLPTIGTTLAGAALALAFVVALRGRRAFVPELVAAALSGIAKLPSRVRATAAGAARLSARTKLGRASVLPIVVPLGLGAVFLGVFALANPVVARAVELGLSALGRFVALPSPGRVLLWMLGGLFAVSLLRPALWTARGAERADPALTGDATETSLLVARNALVLLNALFFAYNAMDAIYLWSGSPPPGVTTQTYAHQGAFWSTVALALLTLVVGVMFRGALAHDARARLARSLAYAWSAQGLVLALGTYRRIAIHVAHTGLSDLRIVGVLGTTLVVVGLVLVVHKLRAGRTFTWLVRRQLDALAITLVVYAVAPTHLVAARVNVARIAGGEYRPLLHMFRQSQHAESATALLPLLRHDDLRVRQGVAALLEQERQALDGEVASESSWRERDLVRRHTLAALDGAAPELARALGDVDRAAAKRTLLEISRVAAEGRSLEEILAIPAADGGRGPLPYTGEL